MATIEESNNASIENSVTNPICAGVSSTQPVLTTYSNPAGNAYPVIAYNNVQLVAYDDKSEEKKTATDDELREYMNTVKDCGFNVNMWVNSPSEYVDLLNRYFDNDNVCVLKTILYISGMTPVKTDKKDSTGKPIYIPSAENLKKVLNLYHEKSNLWGYMLTNQPTYKGWAETDENKIPTETANLRMAYNTYVNNSHGKPAFFNLPASTLEVWIGSNNTSTAGGNVSNTYKNQLYGNYLESIDAAFHPIMLSVSLFPIKRDGGIEPASVRFDYFSMLETIGKFSHEKHIPFWLFMQCNHSVVFNENLSIHHTDPFPTEGVLRFQAMNAIAHGIQGLVFWSYGMPENKWYDDNKTLISNAYYYAPITYYLKTEVWDNCRTVINEIKKYGYILLNAEFLAAKHVLTSSSETYHKIEKLSGQFGCISSATANGKGMVITQLAKGVYCYMAIVSHDFENEQKISINIPNSYTWSIVEDNDSWDTKDSATINNTKMIEGCLKPGGILLIRYKKWSFEPPSQTM